MNSAVIEHNRRILIIDDNRAIHDDFRKILSWSTGDDSFAKATADLFGDTPSPRDGFGFDLGFALQGKEGLAAVQEAAAAARPFALAFVDVRMPPGWDGIETTARLWAADPDLQIVICTAYSDYSWDEMARQLGASDRWVILKKPFDAIEVLQVSTTLAEKWRLTREARRRVENLDAIVQQRTRELQVANEMLRRDIAERKELETQFRQAQKMEAFGQLAAGVAHDFNNILTVIQGNAAFLETGSPSPAERFSAAGEIGLAAERAANLTQQLLTFSRRQVLQPKPMDLNEVVANMTRMLQRLIGEHITLEACYMPGSASIHADPGMMEQVLINLAVNSRDAMPLGGRLTIATGAVSIPAAGAPPPSKARPGEYIHLAVKDTGGGIAPEHMPHIFEPFFTTKEPGKGTGLGLATVFGIVEQHHGWINIESTAKVGTVINIYLPRLAQSVAPSSPPTQIRSSPGGTETILLVEDEEPVRTLFRRILERRGYRVFEAASGVAALDLWGRHRPDIDLLVTDMVMPGGLGGRELAERLRADEPALKIIYCSGYTDDMLGQGSRLRVNENFLEKPFPPDKLLRRVRACLDAAPRSPAPPEAVPAS